MQVEIVQVDYSVCLVIKFNDRVGSLSYESRIKCLTQL